MSYMTYYVHESKQFKKVWQHLMYGVLVVVVEQTMRSAMLC